jgi:WXG100 family type VII secretion target
MNDEINYNYEALQQGVDEMQRVTAQIEQQVGDLQKQTKTAMESWEAAASETYHTLSNKISGDFTAINQMLSDVEKSIGSGADDMRQLDRSRAQAFG